MVALIFSVVVVGVQMTIFSETLRSKMSSWTTRAACCATPCCAPVVDTPHDVSCCWCYSVVEVVEEHVVVELLVESRSDDYLVAIPCC